MNKLSKPTRTQTLTLSDLRVVAGGQTMLATIAKSLEVAANAVIRNMMR